MKFENPESIAAIMLEGESGTSGCIKYPPEYWKRVKEIADQFDILMISDEVMSGFGGALPNHCHQASEHRER